MNFIRKNFKYLVIFIFCFLSMSLFFSFIDGDVLWNYGFAYAISRGEIPYLDFNMIITPFYPLLMALPLLISHNILIFYLTNSLILTIMFYYLFKLFNYKAWLLLIFLIFPLPAIVFPTYNMFLLFLFIIIIYLEINDKNDYLIGFFLALAFLTKQTVGFFLILPSFYFCKKHPLKIKKRFISFSILLLLFLSYLIITRSLIPFLDLCFLGMFDFTKKNGKSFNLFFILTLLIIITIIYKIKKDDENKLLKYYILAFSSITLPLFDIIHFEFFLFTFLLLYIKNLKVKKKDLIIHIFVFAIIYILIFFYYGVNFKISYPNHYKNFEARFLYNGNGEFSIRDKINKYIQKNKNKKIIILSSEAYFYKITNEMDINKFDLINYGNHGYNGTQKLKKEINSLDKNTIFIINYDEYIEKDSLDRQQINKELIKYVIKKSKLIKKINCFRIYKLN